MARQRIREDRSTGIATPGRSGTAGRWWRMTLRRANRGSGTAGRSHDRTRHRHPRLRQTGYVQGMIRRRTGGYAADQGWAARAQDRTGCRRGRGRRQ